MNILYPKDVEAMVAEAPEVLPKALAEAERRGWDGNAVLRQVIRDMVSEAKEARKAAPPVVEEPPPVEEPLPAAPEPTVVGEADVEPGPESEVETAESPARPRHSSGKRKGR